MGRTHCFFHQNDSVTLTSEGYGTYPTQPLTEKSICVLPELQKIDVKGCAGICSDYVMAWDINGNKLKLENIVTDRCQKVLDKAGRVVDGISHGRGGIKR